MSTPSPEQRKKYAKKEADSHAERSRRYYYAHQKERAQYYKKKYEADLFRKERAAFFAEADRLRKELRLDMRRTKENGLKAVRLVKKRNRLLLEAQEKKAREARAHAAKVAREKYKNTKIKCDCKQCGTSFITTQAAQRAFCRPNCLALYQIFHPSGKART